MRSIIEMLFNGDIFPWEQIVSKDPEYFPISHKVCGQFEELQKNLTDEGKELLAALDNNLQSIHAMGYQAHFDYGFKLGMLLMEEIALARDEFTK